MSATRLQTMISSWTVILHLSVGLTPKTADSPSTSQSTTLYSSPLPDLSFGIVGWLWFCSFNGRFCWRIDREGEFLIGDNIKSLKHRFIEVIVLSSFFLAHIFFFFANF
ncbi:hypothetical protein FRX31_026049 [Thalictrum thalictroides]|uniref:Uncharacterized protein n=1 Tax=Thalictrum thalictroides TaxID=46969 RepID=A0A7J6VGX8_THATH|nr:hypothetical protein FRX31_026049 [Thalictrum thalictroides]